MSSTRVTHWVPLESNPDMLTKFAHGMGVDASVQFHDCFGTDPELLAFVPRPVHAVLLLFPCEKIRPVHRAAEQGRSFDDVPDKVWYKKQLVGNACGTIAMLHALANGVKAGVVQCTEDGFLSQFLERTKDMTPQERGEALVTEQAIEVIAHEVAKEGQTQAPAADAKVDFHFIAFVCVDNKLVELDGAKEGPIVRGPTTPDKLLDDAVRVVRDDFMAHDPENPRFSIITLGTRQD